MLADFERLPMLDARYAGQSESQQRLPQLTPLYGLIAAVIEN